MSTLYVHVKFRGKLIYFMSYVKKTKKCLVKKLYLSTKFCFFTHNTQGVSFSWNNFNRAVRGTKPAACQAFLNFPTQFHTWPYLGSLSDHRTRHEKCLCRAFVQFRVCGPAQKESGLHRPCFALCMSRPCRAGPLELFSVLTLKSRYANKNVTIKKCWKCNCTLLLKKCKCNELHFF
jgi:hypothetical protein